ncbi:MAG: Uncharacterized protein CEN90_203 [Parcubacteria group bacterium Licking1014_17]|nr:MAG: Uncharacterized protein CEN90_203 [Parcubacteria group bacterium Licking1014_17]
MDNFIQFLKSKMFMVIILVLFGIAVLVGTFSIGMMIGYRKAGFSYTWAENYHRNFGGPRGGLFGGLGGGDLSDGHGVAGLIIKIDPPASLEKSGPTLIIKGQDNVEKIVIVENDTVTRYLRDTVSPNDLKVGNNIVIIGNPDNSGQIMAKFIRVLPSMPMSPMPLAPR